MDTVELNAELLAVGEKIKAKGWKTASIDIFVQYLAIFDREPGPLDPMISYRPSIRATAHRSDGSFYGSGNSQEYVRDSWDIKSIDQAVAKLHETADGMPTMVEEAARIDDAKGKLSESERRLLGLR
jgi:hypothetical protein